MIIKIIYIIVFFLFFISLSQILVLGSYVFKKDNEMANVSKNIISSLSHTIYKNGFNSPIYNSGEYKATTNIDVIIGNHISSIDFMILISLIRQHDDRDIYCLIKKNLIFTPGFGFIALSALDIKLNRKIEDDTNNIIKSLRKIKSGVIIILPEGTRYDPKKYRESCSYSRENNLTVYRNTLYPKMKGLYKICEILTNENRMGNIIDMTIMIENLKNKKAHIPQVLSTNLGNTFGILTTYKPPNQHNLASYDNFKSWFLPIWDNKDKILDNINTVNDSNIYTIVKTKLKSSEYILLVFIVSLFLYLLNSNPKYILYSFIITYLIAFVKK